MLCTYTGLCIHFNFSYCVCDQQCNTPYDNIYLCHGHNQSMHMLSFVLYILHVLFCVAAAVVLHSLRHIRVQHGRNFTLPCQVGGAPCPEAMFVQALTGNNKPGPALHPYSNPSDLPSDASFWYNRTVDTTFYPQHHEFTVKCIAKNMIVNPPEGVTFKYSTWNTRITIHP